MVVTKTRFTAENWLQLGLRELAAHGPDAVKLAPICDKAGLTRGSFYHHFADHTAFLVGMAEMWLKTQTVDVASVADEDHSPNDRMTALSDAAMAIDYRLELGMREMARRNADVARIVERGDTMRLSVLTNLYMDRFGLEQDAARDYAFLEYAAFAGLILLEPDMPTDRQRALNARFNMMVLHVFADRD
ncbi:MAG: TetR/AcrR family transcriptional regulator [Pseudomonadota bacterium]